ncbi:MAG: OmpA family protein, partial [candidate division KSB1 bacterium]|nr:OmpA family protein [candidate division KSB1 bacterium]
MKQHCRCHISHRGAFAREQYRRSRYQGRPLQARFMFFLLLTIASYGLGGSNRPLEAPGEAPLAKQFYAQSESLAYLRMTLTKTIREAIRQKQWAQAIQCCQQFQERFPATRDSIQKVIDILSAPPLNVTIKNLGPNVNSEYQDYYPVASVTGSILFFTSRNRPGGKGGEDVWVSFWSDTGWTKAMNVGEPINTIQHEGFMNLSPDGTTAFIFGNYPDSYGNGDIFFATLERKGNGVGWSDVRNLKPPINSPDFEADACFSSDGKTVFFVSDRPGGIGSYRPRSKYYHPHYNSDIYVSIRSDTGWCEPINLGPTINTPYCERGPLFHPDGVTLFFCSSGHPGLGDLDIFVATRKGDSWTEWNEPKNLGKEINTIYKDWGYSIPVSGQEVFFASVRDSGYGQSDIYLITLPERLTKPVTIVEGKLMDTEGSPLDNAKITWEDLQSFKILGNATTRPTGDFTILLPSGKWYCYTATKEGYIFSSREIDLRSSDTARVQVDIQLPKLIPDATTFPSALLTVFFDINLASLRPESHPELDRFIKLLREHPEWTKVEISGHTCDLGTAAYNKQLSYERAQAVVDYIVQQGESAQRFVAVGYGNEKPLIDEKTD